MTHPFSVLGVLAVADVNPIVIDDRRRDHFIAVLRPDRALRVEVELPQLLAGLGLVPSDPPVALRRDQLIDAGDCPHSRSRPLAVQNPVSRVASFPHELPGLLVQRDDRRRLRRRNVHVALVLAIRRAHVDQIPPNDR